MLRDVISKYMHEKYKYDDDIYQNTAVTVLSPVALFALLLLATLGSHLSCCLQTPALHLLGVRSSVVIHVVGFQWFHVSDLVADLFSAS